METKIEKQGQTDEINYITEEDVKVILHNSGYSNNEVILEGYEVKHASDKMLGFMADYWRLTINITENNSSKRTLSFFIKAVSRTNSSKAEMIKEFKMYQKELNFYADVKSQLDVPGLKPWAAKFVAALDDALVFQDLSSMQYKLRHKHERFDMAHTLQALRTLASFHASTIIFEDKRSKELHRPYQLTEDFSQLIDKGGYKMSNPWYVQCKEAALEAIKTFSEYSKDNHTMSMIESRWDAVFENALTLEEPTAMERNVICHCDLWNNNILFHYKTVGNVLEPDNCLLVDFQATTYQPLAGDVMLLLYCNLEPKFREDNMDMFLNFYHQELRLILCSFGISIDDVMSKETFLSSAERHRQWGIVACACLIQLLMVDDDLISSTFSDSAQFDDILNKSKANFVKKLMQSNHHYKTNLLAIFDEIVERYCV